MGKHTSSPIPLCMSASLFTLLPGISWESGFCWQLLAQSWRPYSATTKLNSQTTPVSFTTVTSDWSAVDNQSTNKGTYTISNKRIPSHSQNNKKRLNNSVNLTIIWFTTALEHVVMSSIGREQYSMFAGSNRLRDLVFKVDTCVNRFVLRM